jgi:hypothetical protein
LIVPFIPEPLIEEIAEGRCLPFIGAGFSKNAVTTDGTSLPDWRELTSVLASRIQGDTSDLKSEEIAQLYDEQYGKTKLIEAVINELQCSFPKPGSVHRALTRLPFDIIYTTNFDKLIESTYQDKESIPVVIARDDDMSFLGGRRSLSIIKMHGDIDHPRRMVLTTEDYEKYLENHPVMATHLSAMLITRTALFIGYSLSDPNITHINKIICERLGNFKRRSYWIGFDVDNSNNLKLGNEKINVISISTNQGKDAQPNKSDLLLGVLNSIADLVEAKLNPPQKSLRHLSIRGRGFL